MPTLHETFYDRAAADRAVDDLIAQGIDPAEISIVVSSAAQETFLPKLDGDIGKGGVAGGVVGAGLAAICGGLALGGTIAATGGLAAIPFLAAGPVAEALAGGVSGLAVGALIGGLTGAGVAEADAKTIESQVGKGAIVVVVKATAEDAHDVDQILRKDNRGIEPTAT
jgi:hypothetical protein